MRNEAIRAADYVEAEMADDRSAALGVRLQKVLWISPANEEVWLWPSRYTAKFTWMDDGDYRVEDLPLDRIAALEVR